MSSSTSRNRSSRARRIPAKGTALLLIDVINDIAFVGSDDLVEQAEPMALRLARFKRAATNAGVPVIYVNDNFGQWRSDFRQTVRHCTSDRSKGRAIASRLRPTRSDYFVLKPENSGFFGTTLDSLLKSLKVRRLILTGIAGDNCVLFTAHDAHMRGYRLIVVCDCVVSNTPAQKRRSARSNAPRADVNHHLVDSVALSLIAVDRHGVCKFYAQVRSRVVRSHWREPCRLLNRWRCCCTKS